jgi:putative phosphoesterase
VHAGDVGNAGVLHGLRPRSGKVVSVRGNNDTPKKWPARETKALRELPNTAELRLPGGTLAVTHGDHAGTTRDRHQRLRKAFPAARAIVYGHSHRIVCDRSENPWILNPGAAGRARTFGGPSCLLLVATEKKWRIKIVRFKPLANSAARSR